MSWLLKQNKKTKKWRIWTTISDCYRTDWLTEEEMKSELSMEYGGDYKLRVIETYWTFPHGWYDKDTHQMFQNWKSMEEFAEWKLKAIRSGHYYEEIDRKFEELTGRK